MKEHMIYNGQYENEGHSISFQVCEDDLVLISERFITGVRVSNTERKVFLSEAIEYQEHLKKFGYDKIS